MNRLILYPSDIYGNINIGGAKNSALKLLVASILTNEKVFLCNYPSTMLDIIIQENMLQYLGKKIIKDSSENCIEISGIADKSDLIWEGRSIRNTLLILGCLLSKNGFGKVPLPGGCSLGERKYDIHVNLMEAMGANVSEEEGYLYAENKRIKKRLKAVEYHLPIRSTGATENAIMMGCLAEGVSRIWNPHIRPEILDLISMLKKMGAKIEVRGQESIIIEGVNFLGSVNHCIIPDNMQAFTYLMAGAIAGKKLLISNFPFKDLEIPLIFLKNSGLKYYEYENELLISRCEHFPIDISTGPFPGINSDMQPLFAVWGALSKGKSVITDLRFVERYGYIVEMSKMGIISETSDNKLIINGGYPIKGAEVTAIDLRAGAALILLSLVADSETIINDFWMIERGYDNIFNALKSINVIVKSCD